MGLGGENWALQTTVDSFEIWALELFGKHLAFASRDFMKYEKIEFKLSFEDKTS